MSRRNTSRDVSENFQSELCFDLAAIAPNLQSSLTSGSCAPRETITCEEPLLTLDRQVGVNVVHPDGRVNCLFSMGYPVLIDCSRTLLHPLTNRNRKRYLRG